jgi:LysR family transcriptional regulator, glycine cleavage system transcriptional activator
MNHIPSTQALQCFEASARLGSFTLAGDELHLTQGGVSRQILGLEQRLGVALFERQRQGLQLTTAGMAYLSDIVPALRTLERATSQLAALKGHGGILNLSLPASWGNHWLMPRLPQFMSSHPEISLNVLTRVGAADFSNRQIDAAVEFRSQPRTDMDCELLMPLELQAYASPSWIKARPKKPGKGVQLPEIQATDLLQHSTLPDVWGQWWQCIGQPAFLPQGPRYDLMFMAMNAADAGFGVALLPDFLVAPMLATDRLHAISPHRITAAGGYYLSRSPLLRSESAFLRFRDWLRGQLPALN